MLNRRALFFTLLCILMMPTLAFCAHVSQATTTPSEKQTLSYSKNKLEPFVFIRNQAASGLIVDYLHLLETKIPILFEYKYYPDAWNVIRQKFNDGEFEMTPTFIGNNDQLYDVMTKPLFNFNLVLVGHTSNTYFTDLDQVAKQNLRVAVVADSSIEKHLRRNHPNVKLYTVNTIQEGLMSVENKQVDLLLDMAPILSYALQSSGLSDLKIVGILKDQFKLILVLHDASLLPLLNQGIDAISEVERDKLYKKYVKIEIQGKVDYSLVLKMIAIVFFIFIGFGIWLATLKHEIKKRKLAEEKVKLANQRLERSAEELKISMARAAHAHQAKSQFLANMSHEIRTPMNTIIGMTELILRKDIPEKERHYLTKVAEAGHHLLDIINDILDFSKIEANKIQLESIPFQLEELILSISDLISMKAQQKGLELLIDMGNITAYHYKGDPLRLKQILLNLLSNAVKFTTKGEILIRLHAQKQTNGVYTIRFEIKDTGIGIMKDQQERLFSAFSQADMSTTRMYGGTGLGLSIAQGLVGIMNGEIHCESTYGKGSTFWFEIPLHIDTSFTPLSQPSISKALKVLVVDDNETALDIFAEILHQFGVESVTCKSAKEALELLHNGFKADVAIIDWKMEGMDGIELFQRITEQYGSQITSIMLVTAYDKEELITELGSHQPYAVLVKPITASVLFDTLTNMCGAKRLIDPLVSAHEKEIQHIAFKDITVLLVEDNESNQMVACEILGEVGIQVHVTQNGQEALDWLAINPLPDLILMDCQMPILDGFETTLYIREKLGLSLPIVAMTANAMKGDEEMCYAAGMNGYVPKPVDAKKLIQEIARFCHTTTPEFLSSQDASQTLMVPGIHSTQAIARLGGNATLYSQFLKRFAKEQINFMQAYHHACASNDLQGAKRLCHTLKGLAGTLGMDELALLAHQAELSHHPITQNDPLLVSIEHEILFLINQIQKLPTLTSPTITSPITLTSLIQLVSKLKSADATALDDALMLAQSKDENLLEALAQIKSFEFENAIALIEPLLVQNTPQKGY